VTEGGLRDAELRCGSGEAALARDSQERHEIVGVFAEHW
jgi:hypothetical protein